MNGQTAVYGVIGDPVSHSLSPQIHEYFAEISGINMAYLPFHVKGSDLETAICGAHALQIQGLNVTIPHKQAVMPHLSKIDPMAQQVGAVNTLLWTEKGYVGYNTDYIGIQRTLKSAGVDFKGKSVAVLGAGGSAYAACIAAASNGASRISIINRSEENAVFLASHVKSHYNIPVKQTALKSEIVIQTTTLGFGKYADRSPIDDLIKNPDFLEGVELAFDIIYHPKETIFMRQAKEAGISNVIGGFPMLVYQAAAAFELWHGRGIADEKAVEELTKRLHFN
jgi:shikimate dehydrogenase